MLIENKKRRYYVGVKDHIIKYPFNDIKGVLHWMCWPVLECYPVKVLIKIMAMILMKSWTMMI